MQVTKKESEVLVNRQLRFFETLEFQNVPQARRVNESSYTYKFIAGVPCRDPRRVYDFLDRSVWVHPINNIDASCSQSYKSYIESICEQKNVRFDLELLQLSNDDPCLIHGDATLENFVQTENGLCLIDPGDPRGYTNRENDLGKICQSVLTHWELIKYGTEPIKFEVLRFPIGYETICSLCCHWIRIIKNADRHHERVEWYGRQRVLPLLEKHLNRTRGLRAGGLRWDPDRLAVIYSTLLQAIPH